MDSLTVESKIAIHTIAKDGGMEILELLSDSPARFGTILEKVSVSPRTLSERLKDLVGYGIVSRKNFSEIPPRVEYSLSNKGREIVEVLMKVQYILDRAD